MIKHLQPPLCRMDSPGVCTAPAQHLYLKTVELQNIERYRVCNATQLAITQKQIKIQPNVKRYYDGGG